jgi:Domain of unknown function(DUF2779)
MGSLYLSKSQFIRGLQCHKSLWLYKNRRDLLPEPDSAQQALYDVGAEVGLLARQLFPDGEEIEFEGTSFDEKIAGTKNLINSGVTTLYEATFKHDDILVMVDILHKGSDGWELYEVKASTKVKPVHENDVAIQYYVLYGSEIKVKRSFLVHINNQYMRQGNLDIQQLFSISDLTENSKLNQEFVRQELKKMRASIIKGEPNIDIGPYCKDPYECDFWSYCWQNIPEYSIFDISNLRGDKKFDLYNRGILDFKDIPTDYSLSSDQKLQVEAELTGKKYINKKEIRKFFDQIIYPLYFLDFETFNPAVPLFDGIRPYQKIPFQYSLHCQEVKDGELKHEEFLAKEGEDPRKALADHLIKHIQGQGSILVYNAAFEIGVLRGLAEEFPRLEKLIPRIVDLMVPFEKKHIYSKEMQGSYSIKSVLPALIPKMSYENMDISDGRGASEAYATLHLIEDTEKRQSIRQALLDYCKLDTLAMVELLKVISKLA